MAVTPSSTNVASASAASLPISGPGLSSSVDSSVLTIVRRAESVLTASAIIAIGNDVHDDDIHRHRGHAVEDERHTVLADEGPVESRD